MADSKTIIDYFPDRIQAGFVCGVLMANDIRAQVNAPAGMGSSGGKLYGGYTVSVAAKDMERARKLLADLEREARKNADSDEDDDPEDAPQGPGLFRTIAGWLGFGPKQTNTPGDTP